MPSGAAQLRALSSQLKAMADGGVIKRGMNRNLRAAAIPLKAKLAASALAKLPSAGGLNQRVASERITVSILTGPATAGVRLQQKNHDAVTTDSGFVRHPVYGRWLPNQPAQEIPNAAGWWTDIAKSSASSEVIAGMYEVLNRVADQIAGSI